MTKYLESWILPSAMIMGVILHPWIGKLSFLLPFLISIMLFLTFSKISPKHLHIRKLHLAMLAIQIGSSIAVYILLKPISPILAQGAMICILVSPATGSTVITRLLGGDVYYATSFLFISNIAMVIVAPIIFSAIHLDENMSFVSSALTMSLKIFPVLLLPLLCAWFTRFTLPKVHNWVANRSIYAFYVWGFGLAIVTGDTVSFILNQQSTNYVLELWLALAALIICIANFFFGKFMGNKFHEPISCGQTFGQKNTVLGIWMIFTFSNPLASVAPASYILWQNLFNSWQLWRKRKKLD